MPRISGSAYPPQDEHSASLEWSSWSTRLTGPRGARTNVEGQVDVALALNRPAPALVLDASRASLEVEPPDLDALPKSARRGRDAHTIAL